MSDEPEIEVHSDEESLDSSEVFDRDFCYATIRKLRAEIGESEDPARKAFLSHAIGWLFERHLGDPQQAHTHYQEALRHDPELLPSLRALRRRALGQGNWSRYVELTDREIALCDQPPLRAQMRVEKAEVLDGQLDEPTIALEELEKALEDDPTSLQALWCLENLHRSRGHVEQLAETLVRIADVLPPGELTRNLRYEAARLREVKLDDPVQAMEEYEELVEDVPDPRARAALRRLYVRSGDLHKLVADLRREARSQRGRERSRTLYTVARILNDRLGELVESIGMLEEALEADPDSSLVLAELVRLYPLVGKLEQLAHCYREQIRLATDPREKAALYLRMGQLYDEELREDEKAEEAFWKALEQDPENRPALAALAVFYQRRGRLDDLVSLHLEEAAETDSDMRRALAFHRAAEILEDQDEVERAKEVYRKALDTLPSFVPSFNALEQLLERSGDSEGLVELIRGRADREDNPVLKARLLERTARILEERMGDKEGAIETYHEILEIDPTSSAAVGALVRLTRELMLWEDHVESLAREADLTQDEQNVVSILLRMGEIQESRLEDEQAAIDTYQRLMSVDPFYPPAIRNLGRIYYRRRMYDELIGLHQQELDFTTESDERSIIHYKVGKIREERLDDVDGAANAYKAAIMENPRNFAASWALYRILLKREDWLGIIDILEGEAGALPEGNQRAMALVRVGELWEEVLEREDMATDAYMQALRTHPGCREAREALIRLSEQEGNWKYLADLLYQEFQTSVDATEQYRLAMQLGELYLDRTNNPRKAMEWYMRAMELEPESVAALRGTEHALRAAGEWRSFLELRRKLIRAAEDERLRLALLHDLEMLDHLHARTLKKAQAVPLLDVEEIDFGTPSVLADLMLEREVIERGDPGSRLRYFEARRDAGAMPASIRLADAFERSEALLQAGLVDEALEALQEMAEQDVPSLVALVLIERIAERAGDEAHLVKASSALGEAFHEPVFKAESLVRRALAKLDSPSEREGALEDLERALELDPDNEQAFTALVQILGADGRWEQLVEEVEGLVERVRRPERAVEVFATLGSLQWRRLGDTAAAVKSYNRVLKHDAMHPPTLMNLVDLYTEEERDNDAIAVCRHLLASSPDGPILVEATIKLADLLDRADRDASEVIEVLEGALEIDPDSRDVLERLARLYRNNNDTDGALSVVDRLVGTEQEPQRRAELLATQAQLLDESGGESEAVLELLERSLEDHPCCETALLRYVEVMEHQQRWEELASRLKEQIERVDPEDVQGRALLLTKLSSVYREHMDDAERGAVTLRQAFDLDARCGETGRMLVGELCDSDRFGDALEVCERMLGDDPLCIEILPGMVHALDQVGESTRAGMVAELASYLGVEDETVTRTALRLRESRTMLGKVTIGGDDLARIRLDAVEHPARSILEVLGEPGSKALRRELSDYGIERADRLDGTSDPGRLLMKECERAARLLDAGAYDVFLIPSQGSEITVEMHRPPALLFSVIVTELSEVEQRILAVQALSRALLRTAPAFKLAAQELEELFIAAARLFDPDFGSDVTGLRMVEELTAELSDALTKKQRKALEPLVERYREGAWLDFEEWHEAMHATTLRLALLAAGDLGAVLDAVKKRDPVLIGVPLTNAQSRREAFARSDQALAVVRFLLDAGTPELWRRYVGDVSE